MARCLLLLAPFCLLWASSVQGSSHMPQCVMGNGPSAMNDANIYLHGTIGQPVIGLTSSTALLLHQGFWFSPLLFSSDVPNPGVNMPAALEFDRARPNPFSDVTQLRLGLPQTGHVSLKLYDVGGREVASLIDEEITAGYHTAELSAATLPCGVYFCRLRAASKVKVIRLVVAK